MRFVQFLQSHASTGRFHLVVGSRGGEIREVTTACGLHDLETFIENEVGTREEADPLCRKCARQLDAQ